MSHLPLAGIRIVDLTSNFTGPFATAMLADQGAEVVKVEAVDGDLMRRLGARPDGGSPYFANLNRGKRSIAVDLARDTGRELVTSLADRADVFVQNFRPGVIDRLGLGSEVLRSRNERLVYVSIDGYGPTGPLAGVGAYDHIVQALSGMAGLQSGGRDAAPELIRHGVVDKSTGYVAAQAVTAALLARAGSGSGTTVEVSMLDVALHFLWPDGMADQTCLTGPPVPGISRSFRLNATLDGHVAIVAITDAQFRGLVEAAGCAEVLDDPDLATLTGRQRHAGRVMKLVGVALAQLTTEEVLERLHRHDVPCAPALATSAVVDHPQVVATGTVIEVAHPELGPIQQARPPVRFDGRTEAAAPSARLGEHTDEVLAELGWADDAIRQARADGTIA